MNRSDMLAELGVVFPAAPPPPARPASVGHGAVLEAMFAACVNERRMMEADALHFALSALSAQHPTGVGSEATRPEVDEAMVERGTAAAIKASNRYTGAGVEDAWKVLVRNVLTAALAPQQPEKGETP